MKNGNGLLTTTQIARRQRITRGRVNQIARELRLKPALVAGRTNLYSPEQAETIRKRNKKPGPKET